MIFTNENFTTVNGTVVVDGSGVTQPVSGPLTDTELRLSPVPVVEGGVSTAAVTTVPVSTTVATLLTARAARVKVVVFNEAGTLYVKAGTNATSNDYTWRLTSNTTLEITQYTGVLTAIKATGSTNCQVTDF